MNKSKSVIPKISGIYFILTGLFSLVLIIWSYYIGVSPFGLERYLHYFVDSLNFITIRISWTWFYSVSLHEIYLGFFMCIAILIFGILCIVENKGKTKAIILLGIASVKLIYSFKYLINGLVYYLFEYNFDYLAIDGIYEFMHYIKLFIEFLIDFMPVIAYVFLAFMILVAGNDKGKSFKKFWYVPAVAIIISLFFTVINLIWEFIEYADFIDCFLYLLGKAVFVIPFAIVLALYGYYVSSSKGNSIESK